MKKFSSLIFISVLMLINAQAQQNLTDPMKQKLEELSRFGVEYNFLDENTIELEDKQNGWKSRKTLEEPETEAIYNWANLRDIPVLEIDPTQVDTTKWAGWYNYWTYVPVSNGSVPFPLWAYDFDGNGFSEVYGIFGGIGFGDTRAFEVYPDGSSAQRYYYNILPSAASTQILDIDKNGFKEVVFVSGDKTYAFEQPTNTSIPTQLKFIFDKYDGLGAYLSHERMTYMDEDSLIDFVHRGADTSIVDGYMLCVSEYNKLIQNFDRVWYIQPPNNEFDGYDVGDYDGDGLMEILAGSLWGKVWVIENTADNMYQVTFQDTLPFVNLFYQTSGDIDGDKKREFFVGATMGSGNWTVMFETDGDNHYTPRFIFHLLSGGSLDDPTYITDDVDGDGKVEFAILSGGYLYIFKSDGDDACYLWYLKQGPASFQFNFFDVDGDTIKDILWSSIRNNSWTTDIFKGSLIDDVKDKQPLLPDKIELKQNYPNPFNPITKIQYSLNTRQFITLKIFDVLGRELTTLINMEKEAGLHKVEWNAEGFSSGVYVYRLQTEKQSISRKMLLIK